MSRRINSSICKYELYDLLTCQGSIQYGFHRQAKIKENICILFSGQPCASTINLAYGLVEEDQTRRMNNTSVQDATSNASSSPQV
jgi:hypothetical protein